MMSQQQQVAGTKDILKDTISGFPGLIFQAVSWLTYSDPANSQHYSERITGRLTESFHPISTALKLMIDVNRTHDDVPPGREPAYNRM
tara:strand:- start:15613 stop:15876 length:264 start_codon:yes stop_codon:yes gene_type:complete